MDQSAKGLHFTSIWFEKIRKEPEFELTLLIHNKPKLRSYFYFFKKYIYMNTLKSIYSVLSEVLIGCCSL